MKTELAKYGVPSQFVVCVPACVFYVYVYVDVCTYTPERMCIHIVCAGVWGVWADEWTDGYPPNYPSQVWLFVTLPGVVYHPKLKSNPKMKKIQIPEVF